MSFTLVPSLLYNPNLMAYFKIFKNKSKSSDYHWTLIIGFFEKELPYKVPRHSINPLLEELYSIKEKETQKRFSQRQIKAILEYGGTSHEMMKDVRIQDLMNRWICIFLFSPEFQMICQRFDSDHRQTLYLFGKKDFMDLFIFWALKKYPAMAEYFLSSYNLANYSGLMDLSFTDCIKYWPTFAFRSLSYKLGEPVKVIWLRHLGRGLNISKASHLPFPLTKRMAHWMMQAPYMSTFKTAMHFGQIMAMGGSLELFNSLDDFFQDQNIDHVFRASIINFFVRFKEELKEVSSTRILGYINHLRTENNHFSMKGRTAKALLRQMEEYYRELDRRHPPYFLYENNFRIIKGQGISQWEGVDREDFCKKEAQVTYKIIQIKTYKDLFEEGSAMSHCVASYARDCALGNCSIWSLREFSIQKTKEGEHTNTKMTRLATIELKAGGQIIQCNRSYNQAISQKEEALIKAWAEKESLTLNF